MATETAKRVRMLTVIAASILFRPDGRAAIQAGKLEPSRSR
jgi:hypothetical protein